MRFALPYRTLALALALPLATLACDEDDQPLIRDSGVDANVLAGSGGARAGAGGGATAGASGSDASADTKTPDGVPDGGIIDGSTGDGRSSDADPAANTPDFVVVKLSTAGVRDMNFGTAGVARIDLGRGDFLYGADIDAQNRVVLFGGATGKDRTDTDRVIIRLTTGGAVDNTFATSGVHTLNVANLNDNARNGIVQADGKIVSSGYTPQPTGAGTQTANRVVLLRLNSDGTADNTFGFQGVVNANPFPPAMNAMTPEWGMAEAYGVVTQVGGTYVTAGYGRSAPSGAVDIVSFRFSATGVFDTTWGTSNGVLSIDLIGQNDRGRDLVALPDGRVLIVGTGGKAAMDGDALVAGLTSAGLPDAAFGTGGYRLFDYGRTTEDLFGAAINTGATTLASVGYGGGGTADEDSLLLVLPTTPGAAEIKKTVALSESGNDRLLAVKFDANGKIVAVGYLVENGDSVMVAARFNADGTADTTFGTAGVVRVNVGAVSGTIEQAKGMAITSDGSIIVAGVAEH